ncbi:EF-hand 4 multi-domain protein [Pyrenophora tritici-repentis]|uniref:Cytoskeletal-regulatory complex EF hand n=1 Tax=Pyrenophora tritici-repentis TaxID=45151 RepID=A0A2W1G2T4_9PLEO|nr:EF-hand-4 multi-domain protein [Pyrenophora tritici-repentis]KAF7448366.1 EF-hand 4 multi-domain protein [Pyrenophora tritici-repentis]KAF7572082.1 efhand-3 multi-domain protein [Pyrenophora tritici-repentis]KAG9384734.1 EF-hand 4 multi-domain protein [Pyrenophora tritici-repentis]KAI0582399.1 EF-hand-4 multi-domain protein [Pyrenophora tritici-repentis]
MADPSQSGELNQPILNLTPEEKRVFQYLFQQADTEKLGVITGEIAVKFFERTKLAPAVLGEIWQIADTENRGLLTMAGFCQVLRLIGHYQAGRDPAPELAFRPAPLPKFEGLSIPSAPPAAPSFSPQPTGSIQPQMSGNGPIRVPPLVPAKAAEYAGLFEKSGAVNGVLSGENAKEIFEKARLPNEVLGRIWNLSDTEQRGALNVTEFIIAMHMLASYRTGNMKALPTALPPGLYEAASRRGQLQPPPGGRPDQSMAIPRQFSGQQNVPRQSSPLGRQPFGVPPPPPQPAGSDWLISPQEKASYDNLFKGVDTMGRGFITGDQAVRFFSDSGLPEDVLAGIWDLADINSEGQLSKDEFAVAMYLIRQQRKGDQLPTTLPPSLIPPSLRTPANQAMPVTAPQPPPPVPRAPKSAADDLFGLDAFSAPVPAPQQPQSTGGSATFSKPFESDPFGSKPTSSTSPFQPQPRNPASTFKPFMPSSSFGQTLTAHSTGQSGTSGAHAISTPSAMDDLLGGETDAELNKKLTQDSTDLANMSNQMTTLRNQMQEVQNKKTATESDLNSVTTQKRDLELRLSQFKTQFDQEVKAVKALEDRLAASRTETRKLQVDLVNIEGMYQDLQNQHRQVGGQLEADQRENNNLKERIRQLNAEIGQLRPQLDKMRNDARQQKGMVAINKKQLATNEGERDKIKNEMNDLSKSHEEGVRSPQIQTPAVVSPAASTTSQSTNPFFRKTPQPATENTMSPSGFAREGPHKDFDSVFGSFGTPQSTAPSVSFRENQGPSFSVPSGQSVRSSEGPDVPTPSTSPPLSSYQESPRVAEPPAPPDSRQFGSAFLPLREGGQRSDSFSSSVRATAPASRYGGPGAPGNETPTISQASPVGTPVPEKSTVERQETGRTETDNFNPALFNRNFSASPVASVTSDTQRSTTKPEDRMDTFSNFGAPSASVDVPGAFPRDAITPLQQNQTGESGMSGPNRNNSRADPFGSTSGEQPRGGKDDFDAAFAGFGPSRQTTGPASNTTAPADNSNRFNKEFPPIEDLAHDDDSDSNDGRGFDDNFTSASPNQKRISAGQEQRSQQQQRPGTASSDELYRAPPPTTRLDSNMSGLPSPGAQKSPPTYESSVNQTRTGSNQFPPEFGGLLPARENPTSPGSPDTAQGPEKSFNPPGGHGAALFGGSSKSATTSPPPLDTPSSTVPSDQYHSALTYGSAETNKGPSPSSNVPQLGKSAFNDDFDAGFDDLADAKEDDRVDDDFMFSSQNREGLDEFNPVFDSPAASKSNTMASQQTPTGKPRGDDSFSDFEHLSQTFGSQPQQPQPAASSQDWDAIFSNLEASQTDKGSHSQQASTDFGKSVFDTLDNEDAAKSQTLSPQMPSLGRAISSGTEHDDPILKKLTGMGYGRNEALSALEKYDYDINKAADHLASGGQ